MYDQYKIYKKIICIDIKSFFASVEANERGLNIFKDFLVVADESRGDNAITLAITPALKKYGVKSRGRMFEIPKKIKEKTIIAKPQMNKYIEASSMMYNFYLNYFSKDDILVYSIDEVFIDVTNYLSLYKTTTFKLSRALQKKVLELFNIHICIGIGQNMLMSKIALDIESKKTKYQIAEWSYQTYIQKLTQVKQFTDFWGIGKATAKRLNKIGVYSMIELQQTSLEILYKEFGQSGIELSFHANGVDPSILQEKDKVIRQSKSIGHSQVLFRDYDSIEIKTILSEMLLEVILKMRSLDLVANGLSLSIGESKTSYIKGFATRKKIIGNHSSYHMLSKFMIEMFDQNIGFGIKIRNVSITLFNLSKAQEQTYEQLDLFNDKPNYNYQLEDSILKLKNKYGKNKVLLGSSLKDESNQVRRNGTIGGHNA